MNMNPNSFDGFAYLGDGMDSFFIIFMVIYFAVLLLMLVFGAVCYVLSSLAVYMVAKRRGIRHCWLSWLPVGNVWILGSISDQFQYLVKGKNKSRRKILLGIMIALLAMGLPMGILVAVAIFGHVGAIAGVFVLYIAYITLMIVGSVFQYMAYYDLYRSCRPDDAILYLVLSILIPIILPFFLFACRKRDLGMPPRKTVSQELPEEYATEEDFAEETV